jgi:hypothetical protein
MSGVGRRALASSGAPASEHGLLDSALASQDFADAAAAGQRLSLQEAITLALTTAHEFTPSAHDAAGGTTRSPG